MKFILRFFTRLFGKLLGVLLVAVLFVAVFLALVMFLAGKYERGQTYLTEQGSSHTALVSPSRISNSELEGILRDIYHVEGIRWIQPDLIWVTFPAGTLDIQPTCQGIANVWAFRSGLPWVRVESWINNQRLAQATVSDGQIIRPESTRPPTAAPDIAAIAEREIAADQERKAMMGKLLGDIEAEHGAALSKDKATGWAEWPKFRARFDGGRVVEVSVK